MKWTNSLRRKQSMMPNTQTPTFAVNQFPPTLYFGPDPGTQGDPGGGSTGGKKKTGKKSAKKSTAKPKKKR